MNPRSIQASQNDDGVRLVFGEKTQNEIGRPETCQETITVDGDDVESDGSKGIFPLDRCERTNRAMSSPGDYDFPQNELNLFRRENITVYKQCSAANNYFTNTLCTVNRRCVGGEQK